MLYFNPKIIFPPYNCIMTFVSLAILVGNVYKQIAKRQS